MLIIRLAIFTVSKQFQVDWSGVYAGLHVAWEITDGLQLDLVFGQQR